ncbi:hypothetical protein CLF_110734 [Clonorchis sinensis]|uniref:Uncharacterized protein n=1 Tax=Clonorchis sinensis TaxID=79923 RepID=G7YL32_CLOSI|nr:hypothetical protein CLF_110734 [Clonorchis sinensis]
MSTLTSLSLMVMPTVCESTEVNTEGEYRGQYPRPYRPMDPSKLRHFRGPIAAKGVIFGTIGASMLTYVTVSYHSYFRRRPFKAFSRQGNLLVRVTISPTFRYYDPQAEWELLLQSGVLKTVDKNGKPIKLSDD